LAIGAGAKSRTAMGIVIIGGLLFSGFLTLYVIPVIYSFISNEKKAAETVEKVDEISA
jgi:multidrug efflux pump